MTYNYFCFVKKGLLSIILVLGICIQVKAQLNIKGYVYDSVTKKGLTPVRVENLTTHQGVSTLYNGEFQLEAKEGDYIYFTYVGYKNKSIRVTSAMANSSTIVYLQVKTVQLKDVTIYRGPTEYQKDSAHRASIYKSAFEYNQQKSIMTPVTSVYQKFSKKYKNLRKFQDQIIGMEQQKFIDSRYTPELVQSMTKLPEDSVIHFINAFPMDLDYARAASDLEIKMWIKHNFQKYKADLQKKSK